MFKADETKPVGTKVLLRIEKAPPVSKGGIFDPRADKRITPFAVVLGVGDDVLELKPGQTVYYDIYEGWRLDDLYLIIKEEHIYARIER